MAPYLYVIKRIFYSSTFVENNFLHLNQQLNSLQGPLEAKDGKWKSKSGLYTTQLVKASLQQQKITIDFLEKEFEIRFKDLLLLE